MRWWGGPVPRFGAPAAEVWEAIQAGVHPTLALVGADGLQGFAQIIARDGCAHLARLIVAPGLRGCGTGRTLVCALLERAAASQPAAITLNVYRDNVAAIALYRKLGFVFLAGAADAESRAMIWSGPDSAAIAMADAVDRD